MFLVKDNILQTIQDVHEVVLIVVSIVTHFDPSVLINHFAGQFGVVQITFGDRSGPDKNLSFLVWSQRTACSDISDLPQANDVLLRISSLRRLFKANSTSRGELFKLIRE